MRNKKYEELEKQTTLLEERLSFIKISVLPKLLDKFNETEVKIPKRCLGQSGS